MSDPIIKCEGVYKIFGENAKKMLEEANGNVDAKTFQDNGCIVGVNNASFEVSKGEMLVVMGLSGSGKSTLLRCISRLTDATGGKIFIEGQILSLLIISISVPPVDLKVVLSTHIPLSKQLQKRFVVSLWSTMYQLFLLHKQLDLVMVVPM